MLKQGFLFVMVVLVLPAALLAQRNKKLSYILVPDVAYINQLKPSPLNMLDVYMPLKGSNSPVIIWIHGGAWSYGDKENVDGKAEYFTAKGYVFISINYRLSPKLKHPAHVQDVASAIKWVYNNAKHYSANPDKIFLMGHSAGAHLAALVTLDDSYLKAAGATPQLIKGVILMDGAGYDIPMVMDEAANRLKDWYIQAFGHTKLEWTHASPVNYVSSSSYVPPFLITHAGEGELSELESKVLYDKLAMISKQCKLLHYPRKNHQTLNREIGKEGDQPTEDIFRFLQETSFHSNTH